ncbi:PhzF family phenazine biosynthesis isomerase [Rhizobium sp. CG4]|uniref:PhzF family phenazine biosynthesis protein n=1 Tax=Rhizobium sp. CG4 TaxID=2726075 RepID=UPI00203462FB
MQVKRISAFTNNGLGGNPAGVLLTQEPMSAEQMQAIAAEVGYSETVFASPNPDGSWRVRYFAPETEVPFCGHATIALGAVLGEYTWIPPLRPQSF